MHDALMLGLGIVIGSLLSALYVRIEYGGPISILKPVGRIKGIVLVKTYNLLNGKFIPKYTRITYKMKRRSDGKDTA